MAVLITSAKRQMRSKKKHAIQAALNDNKFLWLLFFFLVPFFRYFLSTFEAWRSHCKYQVSTAQFGLGMLNIKSEYLLRCVNSFIQVNPF